MSWDRLSDWLGSLTAKGIAPLGKVVFSVAVVGLLGLARWLAVRLIDRHVSEPSATYRWRKITLYVAALFGTMLLGKQAPAEGAGLAGGTGE